jgi:hypothetical protein
MDPILKIPRGLPHGILFHSEICRLSRCRTFKKNVTDAPDKGTI